MKKNIITLVFLIGATSFVFAQSGAKWSANGNVASTGDFLGTTNNEALVLKANNTIGLKVKPNGELIFKSLDLNANAPSGLVLTNGQGVISRLDFNATANQVLFSNGSWGNLPIVPAQTWIENNGNLSYTHGKVGIGTTNPFVQLDVVGDARISNNLYVGGGIVITDKVNATTEVKGWDIKVDNDLSVESAARLKGFTRIDQGFTFDGITGISSSLSGTNRIFRYGNGSVARTASSCAAALGVIPSTGLIHQFDGIIQIYDPTTSGASGLLNLQTWTGGSSIDASAGGQTGSGGLLLNYFCGNNTYINTGANGGIVATGKNVEIGFPTTDLSTALNINLPSGITNGIKISNPALTTSSKVIFEVKNNGQVFIGTRHPNSAHSDALLGVDGKALFTSVYVNQLSWADYVFKPNYQLADLKDVETYYLKNQHLPEIPSEKEIIENGMNVGDISVLLLKKIEELTLYTVDLNKQVQQLQEQNNNLQKQMNNLKK